jgi:hypothetical protein
MNSKYALGIILSALMVLGVTVASPRNAYAHTFSGDENASFLTVVEEIKAELDLVKSNLASNATIAAAHAEHTTTHLLTNDTIKEIAEKNARLGKDLPASLNDLQETIGSGNFTASSIDQKISNINSLLDETVSVRIEKTQLSNSTVLATMLADLVDETVEHYNGAYGIEEEGEEGHHDEASMAMNDTSTAAEDNSTDDSNSNSSGSPTDEELEDLTTFELAEKYPSFVESSGNITSGEEEGGEHNAIVKIVDYQSAQAYAARAQTLFDAKLKAIAEANATSAVTALDSGLKKFKQAIDDKKPHDEVEEIAHTDVHPNIQKAFNLQVIPEFPLPILAVIFGIASVVAYSRFKGAGKSKNLF